MKEIWISDDRENKVFSKTNIAKEILVKLITREI